MPLISYVDFAVLVQSMAGLEELRFVRHLCLYSNDITKIDHLDQLSELELLWLNDNRISVIEVFCQLLSPVNTWMFLPMCWHYCLYLCTVSAVVIVELLNILSWECC